MTQEELKDWITYTLERYNRDDVERQWKSHNQDGKETLPWIEYKTLVYGDMDMEKVGEPDDSVSYLTMLKRDRRRWAAADLDGDDALTKEEFAAFLHAEDAEHMKDVIVLETIEDIDKDKDGKISLAEYIGKQRLSLLSEKKFGDSSEFPKRLIRLPQAICTEATKARKSRIG